MDGDAAWHLTTEGHVDLDHLKVEVEQKLEFRVRTLAKLGEEFQKKEARLKKLWSARLAAQMAELPRWPSCPSSMACSAPCTEACGWLGWPGETDRYDDFRDRSSQDRRGVKFRQGQRCPVDRS